MKPARTLLPLLTVAFAGVGVASAQFVTSTTTAPGLAPRSNNALTLDAREHAEKARTTRTTTTKSRSSTTKNNDDDDTTTRRTTTRSRTQTSSTAKPTTDDSSSRSITATPSGTDDPSPTSPPNNSGEAHKGGLSAGAAAGIAAGAVAVVAIAAAVAFLLWRRRQGGIRGAVVTGDYPRGMENHGGGEPKLTSSGGGPEQGPNHAGMGEHGLRGGGGGGSAASRRSDSGGSGSTLFQIPPAGTMPGQPGFENVGERPPPPAGTMPGEPGFGEYPTGEGGEYHHSPHGHPQYPGGDLGLPRPVSAFTAYPSPNQPIFPVSPMTPWRPDSSILQHLPPRPQSHSRALSYHPRGSGSGVGGAGMGGPDPPPPSFLVPGGDRARAMSFSGISGGGGGGGMAHVGGGPGHMAELVGSPPLPRPTPSFAVVVEEHEPGPEPGSEPGPARGGQAELPP